MSKKESAIIVDGVYKNFVLPHEKKDSVKRAFTGVFKKKESGKEVQHALHDISFDVKDGEFFGIVGRNGSGKSTLLKMLAGIYQPTKGKVQTKGKLVPFIELGVGFNPELTGRENVYLNGALLGFSKREIDEQYDDIVEFAELERFMDQKLKNYSSGMQVRLAFSVAIIADADILLVDEVLAVGDAAFQRKCFEYFRLLKKNKKTVIFVTHDMSAVREYCDRAMLIEKSKIVDIGKPHTIASQYSRLFTDEAEQEDKKSKENDKRWGNKFVSYQSVDITPKKLLNNDQSITISLRAKANQDVDEAVFGFAIRNQIGQHLMGTHSQIKQQKVGALKKGQEVTITWTFDNIFSEGTYYVDLALVAEDIITVYDWWEEARKFKVYSEEQIPYPINPPITLELKKS